MDPVQLRIPALQGAEAGPVGGALGAALGMADDELILGGGVHHGDFEIAEGITPGQHQGARQQVHMHILLLDPAAGEPAVIVLGVLAELLEGLGTFQLEKGGRVRMAAGIAELQGQIAHQMLAEIQAEVFPLAHAQMGKLAEDDLLLLGAVALLELEAADGLPDAVAQRGRELLGPGEQLFVCLRMEVFNNGNESHNKLLLLFHIPS